MTNSHQERDFGLDDNVIAIIHADTNWIRNQRNKSLLILAIAGIIIMILSIIFQNITYSIIRGLIFLLAGLIVYFKPEFISNYSIQFYRDGNIIVKKGFRKSVIFSTPIERIRLVQQGKNWLIGAKKVKLPIDAFPTLDKDFKKIGN